MRFGWFDFELAARESVRIAFFHDPDKRRILCFLYFLQIKAAGHFTEAHQPVDSFGLVGIICLEEGLEFRFVTRVECFEPSSELFFCRCFRGLALTVPSKAVAVHSPRHATTHTAANSAAHPTTHPSGNSIEDAVSWSLRAQRNFT